MKRCYLCKEFKGLRDFSLKNKEKKVYMSYCKTCSRAYHKEHYRRNRESYLLKNRTRCLRVDQENRAKLVNYLLLHPCVDCGEKDPRVLEFDHISQDKKTDISNLLSQSFSWLVIQKEINKCDVRCANCHKKKTAHQFKWYKDSIVI